MNDYTRRLISVRTQEEWALKDSLERRAQFLLAAGATGASLIVAGIALFHAAHASLPKSFKVSITVSVIAQIVVSIVGLVSLAPFPFQSIPASKLEELEDKAADAQLETLASLEMQNKWKTRLLFVGVSAEAIATLALGAAMLSEVYKLFR